HRRGTAGGGLAGAKAPLLRAGPGRAGDRPGGGEPGGEGQLHRGGCQRDPEIEAPCGAPQKGEGRLLPPHEVRGAFIIGASGGSGVLVARDDKTAQWHGPAFYTLGGANFGFQAGVDVAEVIILAMTERGVTKLLSPQVKLGADISVAAGPVGAG